MSVIVFNQRRRSGAVARIFLGSSTSVIPAGSSTGSPTPARPVSV